MENTDEKIYTDITIADVSLILQIITVCSKRGAINPDEFTVVGNLVNKLQQVVKMAEESNETTEESQTQEVSQDDCERSTTP